MLANSLLTDLTQLGDRMDLFGHSPRLEVSFQVNVKLFSSVVPCELFLRYELEKGSVSNEIFKGIVM